MQLTYPRLKHHHPNPPHCTCVRSFSHSQPECGVAGQPHQLPNRLRSTSEGVQPLLPMCWVCFWDRHTLPVPVTVPISCRHTSRGQGCPSDLLLPLPPAIPPPSSSHRHAGGSCFTDMRASGCPACQPLASFLPAMVQFGMNTLHSVSLAWCVAEAARGSPRARHPT